ncbi:hypothetical protein BAUCODRAFT_29786 [Baudoinia panamericana UAMH 10762]|uniref:Uncharacterized protein n=1 Tax=Baudoinia panamericana (strain UAMH 10762) TaxID=717646 RepID=M2NJX6_BAUPA|nr:uncharacterized protein BAUCODRAFT_29786 [Baudoinia panamericana UAMH 10762]EMC99440.1 hypothetical protein BAUCODRAFT_29786 [Baudoinia panamericana UAMH 10762]
MHLMHLAHSCSRRCPFPVPAIPNLVHPAHLPAPCSNHLPSSTGHLAFSCLRRRDSSRAKSSWTPSFTHHPLRSHRRISRVLGVAALPLPA